MNKNKPYHDSSMWKGAKSDLFSKAINLREKMTVTEVVIWKTLKNKQLLGHKFRRQHPVNHFIVDFYCHKLKLVIEIDGEYHTQKEQIKLDQERTKILEFQGLKVIRFSNEEVNNNISKVLEEIKNHIKLIEKEGLI